MNLVAHNDKELELKDKCIRIYESLISGKGLNFIIETASEILENPVSISDTSYKLLAYSTNIEVDDPIWKEITSKGYDSYEFVKIYNKEKVIEKINDSSLPILVNTGIGKNMSRILGKIVISGKTVAYIGIFEAYKKITNEDISFANTLCSVLAIELSKNSDFLCLADSIGENLLIKLLNNTNLDNFELNNDLKLSSWKPLKEFFIMYIPIKKNSTTMLKIENLRFHLEKLSVYFKSIYLNYSIILIMNFDDEENIKSLWGKIANLLSNHNLKAGVSFKFTNLKLLNSYYKQAIDSYKIGILADDNAIIYKFEDYYCIYLLNILSKEVNLLHFCHKKVMKLYDHDKKNSTEYFSTLYDYLNNSCSISETAKKLYIHKNTMNHRIKRIKEISEINSIKQEDKFRIYLTYKILEYKAISDKLEDIDIK